MYCKDQVLLKLYIKIIFLEQRRQQQLTSLSTRNLLPHTFYIQLWQATLLSCCKLEFEETETNCVKMSVLLPPLGCDLGCREECIVEMEDETSSIID